MRRQSSTPLRLARIVTHVVFAVASALAAIGCSDDEGPYGSGGCRFDPTYCGGGLGSACRADIDCLAGSCCKEKHCGGGMCVLSCNDDRQCPLDMACEHNVCLFSCRSDFDCAVGQRCEHGRTVCEWP